MSIKKILTVTAVTMVTFFASASQVLASSDETSFSPLAPLPGIEAGQAISLGDYVSALFQIGLGLAGVFAVLMLVVAGIQYVASGGSASAKSAARSRITNAIFGLIIAAGSWLLITIINPGILGGNLVIEEVPLPTPPPIIPAQPFPPINTLPSVPSFPGTNPPTVSAPIPPPFLGDETLESFLPPVVLSDPNDDALIIRDCFSRSANEPCTGGDIDGDGTVSNSDFSSFSAAVARYDINGDSTILLAKKPKITSCFFKINTSDFPLPDSATFLNGPQFNSINFSLGCATDEYGNKIFDLGVLNKLQTIFADSTVTRLLRPEKLLSMNLAYANLFLCEGPSVCGFLERLTGFRLFDNDNLFRLDEINFTVGEVQTFDLSQKPGFFYRDMFCNSAFSQCSAFSSEGFLEKEVRLLCGRNFVSSFQNCFLTTLSTDPLNTSGINRLLFSCVKKFPNCYSLSSDAMARVIFATFKRMDTNNDGFVDFEPDGDRAIVNQCIGSEVSGSCTNADMNGDGIINENDLLLWIFFDENILSPDINFFRPNYNLADTEAEFFDAEGYEDRQILEYCIGKKQIGDCSTSDINGDFVIDAADLEDFDNGVAGLDTNGDGVINFSFGFETVTAPRNPISEEAILIADCIGKPVEGDCASADINGDGVIDTVDFNEFAQGTIATSTTESSI